MTVTALSAGNSLVDSTKADIFAGEESILHALSFVRHSAVPIAKKDILRDLFLAYAGTADPKEQQGVKAKILQELQSQPELSSLLPKEKPKAMSTVGMSRPVPVFSAPVSPAPVAPAPAPTETKIPETLITPIAPPAPEIKPEPAPIVPPPVPTPAPVATATVAATAPGPQTPNAKARIDAIKRDINGRVGNPVNLIETDEKVGREYMTALLDAMKRSSRGDNDLTRLETAYQAALTVIRSEPTEAPAAVSATPTEKNVPPEISTPPTPPPAPTPPIVDTPIETPPAPEVVAPVVPPLPPPPPTPPIHDETPKVGLYHRPVDEIIEEEVMPEREVVTKPVETIKAPPVIPPSTEDYEMKMPEVEVKLPPAPPVKSVAKIKVASAEAPAPTKVMPPPPPPPATKPVPTPAPVAPPEPKPTKAVAAEVKPKPVEETKLRPLNETSSALPEQISKLKSAAAARDEAAKKPITDLKAPEIDQGLRLLLAEWVLFKNSGFFRRKPSGIDSPLYKQLAPLPMASVIAGRFEGVTPEIKHTLADYMTGWRYEQGIIHDMGETFENYLRRVVKEILEKQRLTRTIPENSEPKK